MLAPSYKSAQDLGITEDQKLALLTVMYALQRNECTKFDMSGWCNCIHGNMLQLAGFESNDRESPLSMMCRNDMLDLFIPSPAALVAIGKRYADINQAEAAQAVRNFLVTGSANWHSVLEDA